MDAVTIQPSLPMTRKTASQLRDDSWPEPKALPLGLPPVERFDYDQLPGVLREWVRDISERLQCPRTLWG